VLSEEDPEAAATLGRSIIYLKSMAAIKNNANELRDNMHKDKFKHVKSRLNTRNHTYIKSKSQKRPLRKEEQEITHTIVLENQKKPLELE